MKNSENSNPWPKRVMRAPEQAVRRLSLLFHRARSIRTVINGACSKFGNTQVQETHLAAEVRTFAMGAMNAEAVPARARAMQAVFMTDILGIA